MKKAELTSIIEVSSRVMGYPRSRRYEHGQMSRMQGCGGSTSRELAQNFGVQLDHTEFLTAKVFVLMTEGGLNFGAEIRWPR